MLALFHCPWTFTSSTSGYTEMTAWGHSFHPVLEKKLGEGGYVLDFNLLIMRDSDISPPT